MCNKVKYTCSGDAQYATCINFEGTPNPQSSLVDENCLDLEIVTQDQYDQIEEIWNEIDLAALGERCLDYVEVDNKIIVKNVLLKFEEKICELESQIETLQNLNICEVSIADCGLDFGDLTDSCGEQPQTLIQVLQLLLNQHITP